MSTRKSLALVTLLAIVILITSPSAAKAQDGQISVGLRANIIGGTGKPVNDTLGFGLFGRYRLSEKWLVGFGVDVASGYDVEKPESFVGLVQEIDVDVIDASADSYAFMGWIERDYKRDSSKWGWFWTAGLGINSVSVDDATGMLEGGGTFDVSTDAGTEFMLTFSGGIRRQLGSSWALELALRFDQHIADWKILDRLSGATGSVDDYSIRGVTLGVVKSF